MQKIVPLNKQQTHKVVDFINSLYAGIFITIGAIANLSLLSINHPVIGAFLFGFGLYTIIIFEFKLYTGQIGFLPPNLPIILIGNIIGSAATGFLCKYTSIGNKIMPYAYTICENKINQPIHSILLLSIGCGILMYIAVKGYKITNNPTIVFTAIAIFILSSFEHCIAAVSYFSISHMFSPKIVFIIFIMILGNSIGSLMVSIPKRKILDK